MVEAKDKIWIVPLIAGILAILSLLAPAVYMNFMGYLKDNLWLWGLYAAPPYGAPVEFVPSPLVMIPSIVTSALIVVSGILLIIFAIIGKARSKLSGIRNISIMSGILIIASEILWLILVPLFFPMESYWPSPPPGMTITFWYISYLGMRISIHNAGFGIIGGFIAAGLAFLGVGLAHYYSKKRPEKVPKTVPEVKEPVIPTEEKEPITKTEYQFCPECGAKIEDPSSSFCGSCGHEF